MAAQRRLLFLASGLNEVSCRFRVLQFVPYLKRMQIQAEVADLRCSIATRWKLLRSAATHDIVCVHRAFLSPLEQRWLRAANTYAFDFDDAVMFRDSTHRRLESWQRRLRFRRMVAGARRVIAGNNYLARWAVRDNTGVTVIPTSIDLAAYPQRPVNPVREPVIGWIGTRSNLLYLKPVLPVLVRLAHRRPGLRLKVVSDDFVDVPGVQVIKKRWSLEEEVADLSSFQIGIMPLPDDPWTRGKCAVKILQYFAAGVPVVCSPVGTNRDVVEHGRNGFFASSEDEWVARLEELLENEDRRIQFAAAGRDTVGRYSTAATVDAFVSALCG